MNPERRVVSAHSARNIYVKSNVKNASFSFWFVVANGIDANHKGV
jgi:hypothetical protein